MCWGMWVSFKWCSLSYINSWRLAPRHSKPHSAIWLRDALEAGIKEKRHEINCNNKYERKKNLGGVDAG